MERLKILIVDDHRDFRRVVHEFLDRLPNVSVVGEVGDGKDVVNEVEKLQPDVILMDITMPNQNGLEATRIIKKRWPSTKVFITTLHDTPMHRLQAQEAKADKFFPKFSLKSNLEEIFGDGLRPVKSSREIPKK